MIVEIALGLADTLRQLRRIQHVHTVGVAVVCFLRQAILVVPIGIIGGLPAGHGGTLARLVFGAKETSRDAIRDAGIALFVEAETRWLLLPGLVLDALVLDALALDALAVALGSQRVSLFS